MRNTKVRRRARAAIVEFAVRMQSEGLASSTYGNLSMRVPGEPELIVVSPSVWSWKLVRPEHVALVRLDGKVLDAERRPTSELALHTALYQRRPEVAAIVHAHSPAAMAIAALDWTLPPFLTGLVDATGGRVGCVPYERQGTAALADAVADALEDRGSCLLRHHGLLAIGASLPRAFRAAAVTEASADAYLRARAVGDVTDLPADEVEWLAATWRGQWTGTDARASG
jgi:L-fuculose-phosphate aldolase